MYAKWSIVSVVSIAMYSLRLLVATVALAAENVLGQADGRAVFNDASDSNVPAQGVVSTLTHAGPKHILDLIDLNDAPKIVPKLSFAVIGANGTFRNESELFNPTNTTPPFFQIFDDEFLDVLGPNATIRMIAQNTTFAFAHEAPIWHPATDQVSFIGL